jgi:Rho GTPase-activating protein 1
MFARLRNLRGGSRSEPVGDAADLPGSRRGGVIAGDDSGSLLSPPGTPGEADGHPGGAGNIEDGGGGRRVRSGGGPVPLHSPGFGGGDGAGESPAPPAAAADGSQSQSVEATSRYDELLESSRHMDFAEEKELKFIYESGVDHDGRPVVVVVPAHLPAKAIDLDQLLLFVISQVDSIVRQEYSLVYIHSQFSSANRPAFAWLRRTYRLLNRPYKKNLKALYLVHPTWWVKTTMKLFKPFVSAKFWRKLRLCNSVNDLYEYIDRDQLILPDVAKQTEIRRVASEPIFGAPINDIMDRIDHEDRQVPLVVEHCTEFLLSNDAARAEGVFRLCGSASGVQQLKQFYDEGQQLLLYRADCEAPVLPPHDRRRLTPTTVNDVAALLKLYLRELPEPLFPHATYDRLVRTQTEYTEAVHEHRAMMMMMHGGGEGGDRPGGEEKETAVAVPMPLVAVCDVVGEMDAAHRRVLGLLLRLWAAIVAESAQNKMDAPNLAIVFAPNLLRPPPPETVLQVMRDTPVINSLVRTMIVNHADVLGAISDAEAEAAAQIKTGEGIAGDLLL